MEFHIEFAPVAQEGLNRLRAYDRKQVFEAVETYLRHAPTKMSKSRIKRLRGYRSPQYRLRVGDDLRVFYDVHEQTVEISAVLSKGEVDAWLRDKGILD